MDPLTATTSAIEDPINWILVTVVGLFVWVVQRVVAGLMQDGAALRTSIRQMTEQSVAYREAIERETRLRTTVLERLRADVHAALLAHQEWRRKHAAADPSTTETRLLAASTALETAIRREDAGMPEPDPLPTSSDE